MQSGTAGPVEPTRVVRLLPYAKGYYGPGREL